MALKFDGNFNSVEPAGTLSRSNVENARRAICAHSSDADEARALMAMCGIAMGDVQVRISYKDV